jgi:hypothetical protein
MGLQPVEQGFDGQPAIRQEGTKAVGGKTQFHGEHSNFLNIATAVIRGFTYQSKPLIPITYQHSLDG